MVLRASCLTLGTRLTGVNLPPHSQCPRHLLLTPRKTPISRLQFRSIFLQKQPQLVVFSIISSQKPQVASKLPQLNVLLRRKKCQSYKSSNESQSLPGIPSPFFDAVPCIATIPPSTAYHLSLPAFSSPKQDQMIPLHG